MAPAASPSIIKRASASTRTGSSRTSSKYAPITAAPKAIKPSTVRPSLSAFESAYTAASCNGDDAGLKVLERDASTSACPSISPHKKACVETATDRVLTFLQNARAQNIPVRAGKWNPEEDAYLRKLVELFCLGVLDDVEQKSSMRAWLARMLNCCPMRISKKQMHGEKFVGKAKFKKDLDAINSLTQTEYDIACNEVYELRASFLIHWAKDEFAKRTTKDTVTSFEEWYKRALETIPRPKIATNDHLIEWHHRPDLESVETLHEHLRLERLKQRQRVADTAATLNRCYKRQRVSNAKEKHPQSKTQFQDLMASVAPASPSDVPAPTSPSDCAEPGNSEERWLLDMCAESDFEKLSERVAANEVAQQLELEEVMLAIKEPEDEYQCKEASSVQATASVQFDFGLPSKWNYRDALDLPSRDASVWDDNDLLLDGFMLLSDQSLVLWDDSDCTLSHAASASSASAVRL